MRVIAVAIVSWLILLAAAAFVIHDHRGGLVEVTQDKVRAASEVARLYGAPRQSGEALKSGKGLTILFYYDGYEDESKALRQIGLLQGALKNTQPYATSTSITTKVITSHSKRCHVERRAQKILVCNKDLVSDIDKLNLGHIKLVVLSPLDFVPSATTARGKNSTLYLPAYKGVLTDDELNIFLSRFFLHELGHSFGLRDEYAFERSARNAEAVSDNIAYRAAPPNCAPDMVEAKKWWGAYVDANVPDVTYNTGCAGNVSYYYPQKGRLMSGNPQDADYGPVAEDYLRGVLDCFYGSKQTIGYQKTTYSVSHRVTSCSAFTAQYQNFWNE
jgi:hypothetical protein